MSTLADLGAVAHEATIVASIVVPAVTSQASACIARVDVRSCRTVAEVRQPCPSVGDDGRGASALSSVSEPDSTAAERRQG